MQRQSTWNKHRPWFLFPLWGLEAEPGLFWGCPHFSSLCGCSYALWPVVSKVDRKAGCESFWSVALSMFNLASLPKSALNGKPDWECLTQNALLTK